MTKAVVQGYHLEHTIILVSVTGVDKPGLMSMVTTRLQDYQAGILDLGQAIIHDTLGLGLLIELPNPNDRQALEASLQTLLDELGVPVRFTDISHERYTHWVEGQGKRRYILTLLARGFTAAQIQAVSSITAAQGLNIETVRRLSGRLPASELAAPAGRSSIEIGLRGEPLDAQKLKQQLLDQATEMAFDFSLQLDSVYRRNRRLVAFDMDSTLIKQEAMDELAKAHGVGPQVVSITDRAMAGELDFKASFVARAKLLRGMPEQRLAELAETVALNDGAERLIRVLKHFGYKIAVISGGFQYVGERLQARLGLDYVFANALEIRDGVMTGEVVGEIVDAQRKAELLQSIADMEQINLAQTIAIGDGANDLPMLNAAGLGVAFHAKPLVKQTASHAISNFGLDSVLYLMGFTDYDLEQALAQRQT